MKVRTHFMLSVAALLLTWSGSAQLTQEWARIYPSAPNEYAEAVDVQMDAGGNIYTLGNVGNDMLLIKYAPNGDTVWTRRVINAGRPLKIELDRNGDIVVGGSSPGLRKYNSSGNLLWTQNVPGGVYTMSLDSMNNVFVAGRDAIYTHIRKFASNGDTLWARQYLGIGAGSIPTSSTTDGTGNFYLAASHNPNQSQGILIMKYAPNGDTAWTRVYTRSGFSEWATDIQLENGGNIVLAGWSSTGFQLSDKDYAVVKYSPAGVLLWQRHFNGPGNGEDQINDIDVDESGNIYATGRMTDGGFISGTLKLSSSGDSLWISYGASLSSPNGAGSDGRFLRYHRNRVVVGGKDGEDISVRVLNPANGTVEHTTSYENQPQSIEQIIGWFRVEQTSAGGSTIAHTSHQVELPPSGSKLHTVKYSLIITGVVESMGRSPSTFALYQNFPNPFNPSTKIVYRVRSPYGSTDPQGRGRESVELKVYDLLGREVATLVNEEKAPGSYEVTWDATGMAGGVYFYTLTSGTSLLTRRMLLLR
jgi:hypothetical protein